MGQICRQEYLQATDLEASTNYKSKPHDHRMEADRKMYHCSSCKQKFSKTNITTFCPRKNICRMFSHSQRVTDMEEQMNSILHSRDQLEAINTQLQQQNKLLQRVEQGTRGVVPGGGTGDPLTAYNTYQGNTKHPKPSPSPDITVTNLKCDKTTSLI